MAALDAVILCGGKGKRLRSIVNDRPKSMSEFGERPFLSWLMEYAANFGIKKFILCVGYKGRYIKEYYKTASLPWKILCSAEKALLGTGGAIRKAQHLIGTDNFLVMNGDCFCRLNLNKFMDFHLRKKALLSIAIANNYDKQNCGRITLDQQQRILGFTEKSSDGYCNAGIYLMHKEIFLFMKDRNVFSLEYDLFPSLLPQRCFGFKQDADCVDFGTPRGYRRAQGIFSRRGALNGRAGA